MNQAQHPAGPTQCQQKDISSRHRHLDPEIIDAILGKPDAVAMKEALCLASDENADMASRVRSLDDLEMLVENTDNANNLTHLQMYPDLLVLLRDETPDPVRRQTLWVIGTAVENNPKAQSEVIKYDPIPRILNLLIPEKKSGNDPAIQTRAKAIFALSTILIQNAAAVMRLGEVDGWEILKKALTDDNPTIRNRTAFLVHTLLEPSYVPSQFAVRGLDRHPAHRTPYSIPPVAVPPLPIGLASTSTSVPTLLALKKYGIIRLLVDFLANMHPDTTSVDSDFAEKAARALVTFVQVGGDLEEPEKRILEPCLHNATTRALWGLNQSSWGSLKSAVAAK